MEIAVVFASVHLADCEQRALVLRAIGIEHLVRFESGHHLLLVPEHAASAALEQLRRYEEENVPQPRPAAPRLHPRAWVGAVLYALVLVGIAYCAGNYVGQWDWTRAGALTTATIQRAEWWRAITALTLHADAVHLLGNLVFGSLYGIFAAQLLGLGRAWLTILLAAACGNLLDSALMSSAQSTIGASTAVFAMLGLVAAYSWRMRFQYFARWVQYSAPIVAAVALLALTGVGDERTDVMAHLAGFMFGAIAGVAQARLSGRALSTATQRLLGGAALGLIGIAWWQAYFAAS
jgi:membrane associated rhomboid family serine protease